MSQTSTGKPLLSAILKIDKYYNKDGIMEKYVVRFENGSTHEEWVKHWGYKKEE